MLKQKTTFIARYKTSLLLFVVIVLCLLMVSPSPRHSMTSSYHQFHSLAQYLVETFRHQSSLLISRHFNKQQLMLSVLEQVEGTNVNKTGRYVSMCAGNFDNRRLGNQLFNYAAMLHVASLTGRRVAMTRHHPHGWLDQWFNVHVTRVDSIEKELCPCVTVGEGRGLAYEQSLTALANRSDITGKSLLVCGWFQSWKYTVGVEAVLHRQLQLLPNISADIRQYFTLVQPVHWNTHKFLRVGIHIRAGDILQPDKVAFGYTVPTVDYFLQAINLFINATRCVQFLVTSDNIDWTQSVYNLTSIVSPTVSVVYSRHHSPGFDLGLLLLCDSVIMTTGTYGWWGAWLANKTTVYFANWPRKGSALFNLFNRADFFPSNWVSVDGPTL